VPALRPVCRSAFTTKAGRGPFGIPWALRVPVISAATSEETAGPADLGENQGAAPKDRPLVDTLLCDFQKLHGLIIIDTPCDALRYVKFNEALFRVWVTQ